MRIDKNQVMAFKMKGLRQILRVAWAEKRYNSKNSYFGHIMKKKRHMLRKRQNPRQM